MSQTTLPHLEAFNFEALKHNNQVIMYARGLLAALAGCAAGILGLEGLAGFIFYVISSLMLSGIWFALYPQKKYFASPTTVWIQEVGENLVSFLLFWTLAYGLVHIYD
ncbi:hypothetical protein HK098_004029 [Nowakowskiella sp. JEL0407]|nr:hypothetical protein HK098_004029 [Nowakowskiella sp. JEL0407]